MCRSVALESDKRSHCDLIRAEFALNEVRSTFYYYYYYFAFREITRQSESFANAPRNITTKEI